MSGTPASSPAAWRGAGKTCTCTCPDPLSLCGCRHPACLAREGRVGELSEDGLLLDLEAVLTRQKSSSVWESHTSFLTTLNNSPLDSAHWPGEESRPGPAWGQALPAQVSVLSVLPSLHEHEYVFLQLFHYRLHCPLFIYFITKLENKKVTVLYVTGGPVA